VIVAAVPVKRLSQAKSRLAGVLSREERESLVVYLLERTVAALRESGAVDRIALVTAEADLAARLSVEWLPDAGSLNGSLRAAAVCASNAGAGGLLIIPADLAFLRPDDVAHVVHARSANGGVVLAPAEDGGTAALFLTPPDVLPPSFGAHSARLHEVLARGRSLNLRMVSTPTLCFDLDEEADYQRYTAGVSV